MLEQLYNQSYWIVLFLGIIIVLLSICAMLLKYLADMIYEHLEALKKAKEYAAQKAFYEGMSKP